MFRRSLACLTLVLLLGAGEGCSTSRNLTQAHKNRADDSGEAMQVTARQAADVQFALGRSLEESKNLAEAETAYRKALDSDPKRADAQARLAVLCGRKGDFAQATKLFAEAARRDPKNADILCDEGYNFYLQRRWAEAEVSLKRAIAIDAVHARSHNNLGLVYAHQDNTNAALVEFKKAGCDPSDAQANLGLVLAMEGHLAEAKQAYTAALSAKPASNIARDGLRALASAEKTAHSPADKAIAAGTLTAKRDETISRAAVNPPRVPNLSGQ